MTQSSLDRDCEKHGCAKVCLDPKLRAFDDCFPGSIRFGDVDGSVERNGHILWLEWKIIWRESETRAQVRQIEAFTRNSPKHRAVCVVGDPLRMQVEQVRVMRSGEWLDDWRPCTLEQLKSLFMRWFEYAERDGQREAA